MKKLWAICVDDSGSTKLKEGTRYLIEPRGTKARVLISEHNPHYNIGSVVLKNRFKQIKQIEDG